MRLDSVGLVCNPLLKKKIGWVGDIPSFQYDVSKIKKLGFKKKTLNSWQAILKSVSEIE